MEIITRVYALENNLDRYFTGQPCKHGHFSERATKKRACIECARVKASEYYCNNREHISERCKKRYVYTDSKKAKRRAAYWKDPETARRKTKEWTAENKDRAKINKQQYYKKNVTDVKARVRKYRIENKEAISNAQREKYAKLSEWEKIQRSERRREKMNDPSYRDKIYEQARAYRIQNADKIRAHKVNYHARKQNAEGYITSDVIALLKRMQDGKCFYCDNPYGDDYHVDHIYCLSKGGSNKPENICIACKSCNLRKQARSPLIFLKLLYRNKMDLK